MVAVASAQSPKNKKAQKRKRVRLDPASCKPESKSQLTPEMMAYALPGGLAKLSHPKWIYAEHIRYIEDRILEMIKGRPLRMVITQPPRTGKTTYVSRTLPAWYLGRFPDKHVLLITHHTDHSRKQGRYARNLLTKFGKQVFDVEVSDETSAAGDWEVVGHEGGMESLGAGAGIQGKGADLLILDDIVKGMKMAMNTTLMEEQWDWFTTDVLSRLEPGASAIVTNTRWTTLDVPGHLEDRMRQDPKFEKWDFLNFPALAEEGDLLGREVGVPLFPQRYSQKSLLLIKDRMDPFWFDAMYQGKPAPNRGAIIKIDTLQRYEAVPERKSCELVIVSVDTAMKETELSDYTVFGIWFIHKGDYYLVDVIRERMEFTTLVETTVSLSRRVSIHPDLFLIEDKGSGTSLIQHIWRNGSVSIVPMNTSTQENKILRMENETMAFRTGRVWVPKEGSNSWVDTYVEELRVFPKGRKDQVDMTSQFLKFMRERGGLIDMY